MPDFPIHCPKCGNQVLKFTAAPPVIDDVRSIFCTNCGHFLSEKDIMAQVDILVKKSLS